MAILAVLLFRTATNKRTFAFCHGRSHKRNPERDVLGHVFWIREIQPAASHRAHWDILANLCLASGLEWMPRSSKPRNFDGLLAAWLDALELNKQFYADLFA